MTDMGRVLDGIDTMEASMTARQRQTYAVYYEQIDRVMQHIRYTAELDNAPRRGESWWLGHWPAYPRAAAAEVAVYDNDHHNWDFGKLLDSYISDLRDHGMTHRLNSLDELLGEVGCDIFD